MKEYQNMHFDELLQAAVSKAVADEQSRAATATQTSTNRVINEANAVIPGAPAKVNNVRDLQTWFAEQTR